MGKPLSPLPVQRDVSLRPVVLPASASAIGFARPDRRDEAHATLPPDVRPLVRSFLILRRLQRLSKTRQRSSRNLRYLRIAALFDNLTGEDARPGRPCPR